VKRRWWVVVALVVVVAGAAVGVQVWRTSASAADARQRCLANQRVIEAAASEYQARMGEKSLAELDGPVAPGTPLTMSTGKGDPFVATPVPVCPSRPGEYYILKDGRTQCPVHGTYE